jgi:regulator of sigma E protease
LADGKGAPIALTVRRNGAVLPPIVVKPYQVDSTWRLGFTRGPMKEPPLRFQPMPIGRAVASSADFSKDSSLMIVDLLKKLFTHQASIKEVSGPIGIIQVAGDAATSHSWDYVFKLSAAISINLGIVNLLPFPILDGGMILFLLIESVLRRAINIKVKEIIYQAAFLMILAFFLVVSFNDIARLPIFMHFKP